jgi:ribosome maturation factor RimP
MKKRASARFLFFYSKGTALGRKPVAGKKKRDAAPKPKVNQAEVIAKAEALAGPVCDGEGLELVHVEFQREPVGWVLRIYVDKAGGVNLDDCTRVSRQLGDIFDVGLENIFPYNLEVSSPGEHRPMGKMRDFERFKGRPAVIKIREPIEGQKKFKGILEGTDGEMIHLRLEDKTVTIPFQGIVKARLA